MKDDSKETDPEVKHKENETRVAVSSQEYRAKSQHKDART
jgi:hypothetical protein